MDLLSSVGEIYIKKEIIFISPLMVLNKKIKPEWKILKMTAAIKTKMNHNVHAFQFLIFN